MGGSKTTLQFSGYDLKRIMENSGFRAVLTCDAVAKRGHLNVVKFISNLGFMFLTESTFANAAESGNLDMLKWLKANGCPMNERTCAGAALAGHLEALKLLREFLCPWDRLTCINAAKNGHLDSLKWARMNGCPWSVETCVVAAERGHLEILKWARMKGCPWSERTCSSAAGHGHLDLLKWARRNNCPWDAYTCTYAARRGDLQILKWARTNGCPWDASTCSNAAKSGHLEMLKWARRNGCPWDASTCSSAAETRHYEIPKWAKSNRCPWDAWTFTNIALRGNLEMLKWARTNGCPWDEEMPQEYLLDFAITQYLRDEGFPVPDYENYDYWIVIIQCTNYLYSFRATSSRELKIRINKFKNVLLGVGLLVLACRCTLSFYICGFLSGHLEDWIPQRKESLNASIMSLLTNIQLKYYRISSSLILYCQHITSLSIDIIHFDDCIACQREIYCLLPFTIYHKQTKHSWPNTHDQTLIVRRRHHLSVFFNVHQIKANSFTTNTSNLDRILPSRRSNVCSICRYGWNNFKLLHR